MIVDRINALMDRLDIPRIGMVPLSALAPSLHRELSRVDSAIGADTEWLFDPPCSCKWHYEKVCSRRRAVGARVRMLEEMLAR
jgi:hypothetical protein